MRAKCLNIGFFFFLKALYVHGYVVNVWFLKRPLSVFNYLCLSQL